MLMGSIRSSGGRSSPPRRQHVADDDGKIADVAGGLRRKSFAKVQRRQGVVDLMAEALEEARDLFQLGGDMRRRLIVAPLVRERDSEPGRVARDHPGVRFRRTPERHELARRRTAAGIDEGRGIAHGA